MSLISFVFVHSVLLGFIYLRRNLQCYNKKCIKFDGVGYTYKL